MIAPLPKTATTVFILGLSFMAALPVAARPTLQDAAAYWGDKSLQDLGKELERRRDLVRRKTAIAQQKESTFHQGKDAVTQAQENLALALEAVDQYLAAYQERNILQILDLYYAAQDSALLMEELRQRGIDINAAYESVQGYLDSTKEGYLTAYGKLQAARDLLISRREALTFQTNELLRARRDHLKAQHAYLELAALAEATLAPPYLAEFKVESRETTPRVLYHGRWEDMSPHSGDEGNTLAPRREQIERLTDLVAEFQAKQAVLDSTYAKREEALTNALEEFQTLNQSTENRLWVEVLARIMLDIATEAKGAIQSGGVSAISSVFWALVNTPDYSFPKLSQDYLAQRNDAANSLASAEAAARQMDLAYTRCFDDLCVPQGLQEGDMATYAEQFNINRASQRATTPGQIAAVSAGDRVAASIGGSLAGKTKEILTNPSIENTFRDTVDKWVSRAPGLSVAIQQSSQEEGIWATLMAIGGSDTQMDPLSDAHLINQLFVRRPTEGVKSFRQYLNEVAKQPDDFAMNAIKGLGTTLRKSAVTTMMRQWRDKAYLEAAQKELTLLWLRTDLFQARKMQQRNDELLTYLEAKLDVLLREENVSVSARTLNILVDKPITSDKSYDLVLLFANAVEEFSYGLRGHGAIQGPVAADPELAVYRFPVECLIVGLGADGETEGVTDAELIVSARGILTDVVLDGDPSTPAHFSVQTAAFDGLEPRLDSNHYLRFETDPASPMAADGAAGPPRFRDPAIDPMLPLEGNWIVRYEGHKDLVGFVTLSKGIQFRCKGGNGGCWSHVYRDEGAEWDVSGKSYTVSGDNQYRKFGSFNLFDVDFQGSQAKLDHGILTPFGSLGVDEEIVRFLPGSDVAWGETDRGTKSHWQRVHSEIDRIVFRTGEDEKTFTEWRPGAPPPKVVMEYTDVWERGRIRANRPEFYIRIYGKNLWGFHYPWIDRDADLELHGERYVCADGSGWQYYSWDSQYCITRGGTRFLDLIVKIWHDVQPGPKTFYFDGTSVPFDLVVNGFPNTVSEADGSCTLAH